MLNLCQFSLFIYKFNALIMLRFVHISTRVYAKPYVKPIGSSAITFRKQLKVKGEFQALLRNWRWLWLIINFTNRTEIISPHSCWIKLSWYGYREQEHVLGHDTKSTKLAHLLSKMFLKNIINICNIKLYLNDFSSKT